MIRGDAGVNRGPYRGRRRVVDRHNIGYRVRWASPDGPMVFQQHAFFDLDGAGRISRWHLVCSGDQPVHR